MAEIPQYIARDNANTPQQGQLARNNDNGKGLSLLGAGMMDASKDVGNSAIRTREYQAHILEITKRQNDAIQRLAEQKTKQVEALEVNQKFSQLRTDWNNRLMEYQQNPTDNLLDTATNEFDDYTKKLIEGGRTSDVKDELSLHASEFRIGFRNEVFRLQSKQQLSQFGAAYDQMMSNAEDSIFSTKSLGELQIQKNLLNKTVDDAVNAGQIKDPQVIQNLKDKANLLSVSWAESVIPENPELAQKVINGEGDYKGVMQGVDVKQKEILLNKIKEVQRTADTKEKMLLHEALQSDITQRTKAGIGNATDLTRFRAVFGNPAGDAAERALANADKLHGYFEEAKGADENTLNALLQKSQPKSDANSITYHEEDELHKDVVDLVNKSEAAKKADAFTYFSLHPTIKPLLQKLKESNSPENKSALQNAVLDLQKSDPAMTPADYKIMPKEDADKFVKQFNSMLEVGNKTQGAGVRELLQKFYEDYGTNANIAFTQLNAVQGGDKITPKINPLLWHINNPSTFRLIVDAVRKNPTEEYARFGDEKLKKNFLTDVNLDKNLLSYQNTIYSNNNTPEGAKLVAGVNETFRDFSRDYILNGGNIKDASSLFFSTQSFGEVNGVRYSRPRVYSDKGGDQHVMSDKQIELSNGYLEWYPKRLDPKNIDPTSILNQTKYFTSEQLTKDTENALQRNVFWATTEDETGVYLYTKGALSGAPRQVKNKDGTPVRVNFIDSMTPVEKIPYGGKKPVHGSTPRTDDTWMDSLAQSILGSS